MAAKFYGIVINAALYTPTAPIELTVANQATLSTYLNGLGFGNFSVLITSTSCTIMVLQTEHNIVSFATVEPDVVYNFAKTNCVSLESDDTFYCDYQLNTTSDPSDSFVGIVVDSVLYKPTAPILASDVTAVNAYLASVNLGFINYQNQGGIYMIATLTPKNISYVIINKSGVDTVFTFVQSNCHVPVLGCMDPLADNYNPQAEISDGSCRYGQLTYGCTDPLALNYDATADRSDDSCIYEPVSELNQLYCCAGDLGYKLALDILTKRTTCDCCWSKLDFILSTIEAILGYTSLTDRDQTTTIEGYVSKSTLSFADFDGFGILTSVIIVDGEIVGVLPLANYADINEFLDGIVAVVEGYNATHELDSFDLVIETEEAGTDANGLIVQIVINPDYELATTAEKDNRSFRQVIHINDTNSLLYGKTIAATRSSSLFYLEVYENGTALSTIDVNSSAGAYGIVHNPVNDTVLTGSYTGLGNISVFNNSLLDSDSINIPGITGIGWAVFNPSNNCMYFASDNPNNKVIKIDSSGVQTVITGVSNVVKLAVDGVGDVWCIGKIDDTLYKISGSDDSLTQITATGETASDLCYYPGDGSVGSERMLIAFSDTGVLRSYNLDGTVATSTLYSLAAISAVIYSSVYNVIFVGSSTLTRILNLSGVMLKSFNEGASQFVEDIKYKNVIGVETIASSPAEAKLKYYRLGNDGEEVFDGPLENGVEDQVVTTTDPNPWACLTYDELEKMKERALNICQGCCSNDSTIVSDSVIKN